MRAVSSCLTVSFFLTSLVSIAQPQYRPWQNPANDPGETLHIYGAAAEFATIRISEDFGPRQLGQNPYDWHGGIDYNAMQGNADYGYLILALEGGAISEYSQMFMGTKSVLIEADGPYGNHLRYVHVFTGGVLQEYLTQQDQENGMPTGGCLLKSMDDPNDDLTDDMAHRIRGQCLW